MNEEERLLLEACVLVGKVMLENGAEMYRVEDTMNRIAGKNGKRVGISFVTPTVVIMGIEDSDNLKMRRVTDRSTNLSIVEMVNRYSREYTEDKISLYELKQKVLEVEGKKVTVSSFKKILVAAIVSASLMIILGGTWKDFIATFLVGGIGYSVFLLSGRFMKLRYFDEFFAALTIGLVAIVFAKIGFCENVDSMVIGSVMPFVPGLSITNTIRDLQQGHILAGISRGVESIIIAMMLGVGIAVAFKLGL